jgi:hypothetical protein
MAIEKSFVTVCGYGNVESVSWTVKLNVPIVVGVPLIRPVAGLRARPAGSDPEMTLQP